MIKSIRNHPHSTLNLDSNNRKSEVTRLLTNATIVDQFDKSYFSAYCKVRHKCKMFAMGQCKGVQSHYLANFVTKYNESEFDDSIYSYCREVLPLTTIIAKLNLTKSLEH